MDNHWRSHVAVTREEETALVDPRRLGVSGAFLALSAYAFFAYASPIFSPRIVLQYCGVFVVSVLLMFHPRLVSFRRQTRELVTVGAYGKPAGSPRGELRKAVAVAVSFVLLLTAPLLLTRFLDPATWIAMMTGAISGYGFSDALFTAYVALWQRRRGIVLKRYKLWTVGLNQKRILLESGIRRANR